MAHKLIRKILAKKSGLPMLEIEGKQHLDPFDRMLIAQTITEKYILLSSDRKFPSYQNHGLKLLVNEC